MSGRAGRVLMVQGTASSVGKSVLVTGLCRLLRQDGWRVAPFKAQNMSNNSFVTATGEEMGRAQVAQAEAAGVPPDVRMNPILLKPEADHRSQAVVLGRPAFRLSGGDFLSRKAELWPVVTAALDELRAAYDVVVIEGAGSPAEINLRAGDIVNMRVARYADAPVLLAGDIDRGGVFAHLYGTLALLEPAERALVRGLLINKFRGDRRLLEPGLRMIEERAGVPVLGVLPYLPDLHIADEDAVAVETASAAAGPVNTLDVAVIGLPRIANFDDFDPLNSEPDVTLRFVTGADDLGRPDLVILPGTKATVADLAWMRARGLDRAIVAAAVRGSAVLGICGGYQMLGKVIHDRDRVEADDAETPGLALLDVVTDFAPVKATHQVRAVVKANSGLFAGCAGQAVRGYEIHMGRSEAAGAVLLSLEQRSGARCTEADGALSADGWVAGTYLHGLFDNAALRTALLANLGRRAGKPYTAGTPLDREAAYDRLANCLRSELDMTALYRIAGLEARAWAG